MPAVRDVRGKVRDFDVLKRSSGSDGSGSMAEAAQNSR
jgi:hypothetical protein